MLLDYDFRMVCIGNETDGRHEKGSFDINYGNSDMAAVRGDSLVKKSL